MVEGFCFRIRFQSCSKRMLKLQNEIEELEQYGRRLCIRIDGIPEVSNENSEDVFNIVDLFVKAGIEDVEKNIGRAHRMGKS